MAGHRLVELDFSRLQRHRCRLSTLRRDFLSSVRKIDHHAVQPMSVRRIFDVRLVYCFQDADLIVVDERLSFGWQNAWREEGQSETQRSERSCFWHSFSIYRCRTKSPVSSLGF